MKKHTLPSLWAAYKNDLKDCQTRLEKTMVNAISGREIKDLGLKIAKERRLTPEECRILDHFGGL
jgi:hypothetical protein